jgi:hypothetical protein
MEIFISIYSGELKMKIDNIKEEVTHDMENHRKKNEIETHSSNKGNANQNHTKIPPHPC